MAISLYNEALNAAEELKLAAEEKAKQQLIEAMTPQIKLLVEQNLMLEKTDDECGTEYSTESDKPDEECAMASASESDKPDEEHGEEDKGDQKEPNPATKDGEKAAQDDKSKGNLHGTQLENHELSSEASSVISRLISANAKKAAAKKKISEIRRNINVLKKATLLAENGQGNKQIKRRINSLYKNLVTEAKNITSYDIFKKDRDLLREFYNIVKELNNMSRRRRSTEFLNENLEDLLEMNLFEEDGDEEEETMDMGDMGDMDMGGEEGDDSLQDLSSESDAGGSVSAETTVEELAQMAGLLETDEGDADEADADEGDELPEGLWETDEVDDSIDDVDDSVDDGLGCAVDDNLSAGHVQDSYRRNGDVFLEIDENMLRKEISRMKAIREGEAKDMASHFGGGSLEGEAFVDGVELNKLHEMKIKAAKVVRKNRMLESKLSQYKKALRGMKTQLAEMNLFNAKLLYANKLMQNRDLTIKQQRNIVESLDEANTLGEAKILFESLSKSLVRPTNTRNSNLSEGAVRRPMSSSSRPVRSAQPITESVALDRWATLAGIKK